jgi:hypothetical protein
MSDSDPRVVLKMMRRDYSVLGQVPVATDFEPARECARFTALRRGTLDPDDARFQAEVEPIWHATAGEPYIQGFRVNVEGRDRADSVDFTIDYWTDLARDASQVYTDQGLLAAGDVFYFSVMAFPGSAKAGGKASFSIEETRTPPVVLEGSLLDYLQVSLPTGSTAERDYPVFIPPRVLEETEDIRLRAGAVETGGVLLGHLRCDPRIPEIFAEVTAQIPAEHTKPALHKVTFTSETWTEVRNEIDSRGKGELLLGYWHSHPVKDWSKNGKDPQASGAHTGEFFSTDDCAVMRTVFWQAYAVGLLISDVPVNGRLWTSSWSLYGWRGGIVQPRSFHILDVRRPAVASAVAKSKIALGGARHG